MTNRHCHAPHYPVTKLPKGQYNLLFFSSFLADLKSFVDRVPGESKSDCSANSEGILEFFIFAAIFRGL